MLLRPRSRGQQRHAYGSGRLDWHCKWWRQRPGLPSCPSPLPKSSLTNEQHRGRFPMHSQPPCTQPRMQSRSTMRQVSLRASTARSKRRAFQAGYGLKFASKGSQVAIVRRIMAQLRVCTTRARSTLRLVRMLAAESIERILLEVQIVESEGELPPTSGSIRWSA